VDKNLLKLADKLDNEGKFNQADSIAKYLLEFNKSKALKSSTIDSEIPTKLLMLEKAGVETKHYFEKFKQNNVNEEDLKEINEKLKKNCPEEKIDKKDTDFHEYVLYMTEEKNDDNDDSEMEIYLDNLRENFIEFLIEKVVDDFKKDSKKPLDPKNLVEFYFTNREKYENDLDTYDLMLGQTEGIISDEEFEDELVDKINNSSGEMIRRAK